MFNWLLGNRRKKAAAKYKAELKAKLTDKLKNYNADEDISVSNFSEVNFNEIDKKTTGKKGGVKNVDSWQQANPSEIGRRKGDEKRQTRRRQLNRRRAERRR